MHNKSREWVKEAVEISLKKSGLDYIDLYLVHDPNGGEEIRNEVWKGCCDVKDLGLVKSIGVSLVVFLKNCVFRILITDPLPYI